MKRYGAVVEYVSKTVATAGLGTYMRPLPTVMLPPEPARRVVSSWLAALNTHTK